MKYLAIIEQSTNNFSAYIPDVPGCIATGKQSGSYGKS
jgi:predicted RNase H-like HicB family nuclease